MTDTALASVQWIARCARPNCVNRIGATRTHCPWHIGVDQYLRMLSEAPVSFASYDLAYIRGEFRRPRAAA